VEQATSASASTQQVTSGCADRQELDHGGLNFLTANLNMFSKS
jgi:hypothetical protein